jgi:hypothetical protein
MAFWEFPTLWRLSIVAKKRINRIIQSYFRHPFLLSNTGQSHVKMLTTEFDIRANTVA